MTSPGSKPSFRKIQFIEKSGKYLSAHLTLPISWIQEQGLEKGDTVKVTIDGSRLIIEPTT